MKSSVGKFVGATVDFNVFLEQNIKNFVSGKVARRTWKSNTPNISTFKNHIAAPYSTLQAMDTNNLKPSEKFIIGGELQNTSFKRYGAVIKMEADYLENISYMAEQSIGGPTEQAIIDMEFAKAGLQTYLLTSEALLADVIQNEAFYDNTNIISLTTPLNKATTLTEFIGTITEVMTAVKLNTGGGLQYQEGDAPILEQKGAASPVKIIVPISVMNRLRQYSNLFHNYMPYNGMGNAGNLRIVDTNVIQQLFQDADCFTPTGITVEIADQLYYEDAMPSFIFDESDAIYVLYNVDDNMGPSSLVMHETELMTEYDADIFDREMKMMQKKAVELKQPNTMFKINNLFTI